MRSLHCRRGQLAIIIAAVFMLLLLIAGCVISPRRVVNEAPSPTPTPNISPTPTPGTTPTPTPTPMAATVPAQFLFVGDGVAPLITGFRINGDGSLAPVPGSPFVISVPARSLVAIHGTLVIADGKGIVAYKVDKQTGSIQQIDAASYSMEGIASASSANIRPQLAVLDSTDRFMYVVDSELAELRAFRVKNGKLFNLALRYQISPKSDAAVVISFSNKDQFAPD
jgi:6-phosphogluconolactonase (cycloisomerase 2 family)